MVMPTLGLHNKCNSKNAETPAIELQPWDYSSEVCSRALE